LKKKTNKDFIYFYVT